MEPVRSNVDRFVLKLLTTRELERGDVFETREGVCRLGPELARQLAASASQLRSSLMPEVGHLRSRLLAGHSGRLSNNPNPPRRAFNERQASAASNGARQIAREGRADRGLT